MRIAIHQPEHLPYLGFMYKMSQCDLFVLLDDVQFQKNGFQNRNRIKTSQGAQWITVPVLHSFGQKINEVNIENRTNWSRKHMQSFQANYAQAPYFWKYSSHLQDIYSKPWVSLCELNMALILFFAKELGLQTKILRSSSVSKTGEKNELLLSLCKTLHATSYLSGMGASYLDVSLFQQNNIPVQYTNFTHPSYQQLYGEFLPNMSTLDLLMNCGPASAKILREVA